MTNDIDATLDIFMAKEEADDKVLDEVLDESEDLKDTTNSNENTLVEFDFNKLPDKPYIKYIRVPLGGQTVRVKSARLVVDDNEASWNSAMENKNVQLNPVRFIVEYDTPNNDHENYAGVTRIRNISDGKPSLPSFLQDGKSQAAHLFQVYKQYVITTQGISEKDFKDNYGLKQLLMFLNTKSMVQIVEKDYEFKKTTTRKNMIGKFL